MATTHPHIDPATYADHVQALTARGDVFEFREQVPVEDDAIEGWIGETFTATRHLATAARAKAQLRNRSACVPFVGTRCPWRGLCEDGSILPAFARTTPKGLRGSSTDPAARPEAEADDGDGEFQVPF